MAITVKKPDSFSAVEGEKFGCYTCVAGNISKYGLKNNMLRCFCGPLYGLSKSVKKPDTLEMDAKTVIDPVQICIKMCFAAE